MRGITQNKYTFGMKTKEVIASPNTASVISNFVAQIHATI